MHVKTRITILILASIYHCAKAEIPKPLDVVFTNVSTTFYVDNRSYSTVNLVTAFNELPLGFQLWGSSDFHAQQGNHSSRLERHFAEFRLSKPLGPHLNVELEYNRLNGNEQSRLGITYRHVVGEKHHTLQWRIHPIERKGSGWQTSVIYKVHLTSRFTLSGFADYNGGGNRKPRWVIEPQINYRVNEQLTLVMEFRHNGFEEKSELRGSGVALGIAVRF